MLKKIEFLVHIPISCKCKSDRYDQNFVEIDNVCSNDILCTSLLVCFG